MAFRIVGRYLSPFLARLSVAELHSGEVGDALRIEIDAAAAYEVAWPT